MIYYNDIAIMAVLPCQETVYFMIIFHHMFAK